MTMTQQEIIDDIRALSVKNYANRQIGRRQQYGWSVIVECYDDAELLELICEDNPTPTLAEAINTVEEYVDLWSEQYEEVQSTAW